LRSARKQSDVASLAPPPPEISVLTTAPSQSTSSTTFSIPRKSTILSDDKPHKVTIAIIPDLSPRFTYSCIPCKTSHVYLKASAQNTTKDFPFLAGPMAVFMDNNFVTNSQIKTVNPKEEFGIFLGVDPGIRVEYKPPQRAKETQGNMLTGKSHLEHYNHLITVKNTKSIQVSVVVYDQLPLSSDEKIKVKLIEPNLKDPAKDLFEIKLNKFNNLEWRMKIEAGKKAEVPFNYDIEWPKDKEIDIICDQL